MMIEHMGLVFSMAKKRGGRTGLEGDLTGAGFQGLMEAHASFDASKGYAFSTHAFYAIRQRINETASMLSRPVSGGLRSGDGARAVALDPPIEEATKRKQELDRALQTAPEGEGNIERRELARLLDTFRGALSARERDIWDSWASDEGETQGAIGARHGVSKQRIGFLSKELKARAAAWLRAQGIEG